RVNRIVHGLRALGLDRGDAVAVVLKNEAALLELFLAATQAGMYLTPINANLAAPEIAYILQDSDAKAFVVSDRAADVCVKAADSIGFPAKARF
ncbi:AMP-binding protein, partial [Glaesserella parasuis]|uniref:AMP-binding protein n=1 Tax=Glaesserella parasuis TaxID=738 RepID=UPI003F410F33